MTTLLRPGTGALRCYGTARMRQKLLVVALGVFVNTSPP